MSPFRRLSRLALALSLGCAAAAVAQVPPAAAKGGYQVVAPKMFPGAPVAFPPLKTFVQGEPVHAFAPRQVYVFAFFSTTCGHCAEAAPLLAEHVRNYRPLGWEFISIAADDEPTIRAWLGKPGVGENYTHSIVSDPERAATRVLQYPTFRNSNPRMFVVQDGTVLWIGHPNQAAEPLERIARGTFKPEEYRTTFVLDAVVHRAREQGNVKAKDCERTGDWQPCIAFHESVATAMPAKASAFELQKFGILVGPAGRSEEGYAFGRGLAGKYPEDLVVLRTLARTTLNSPQVQQRDLDFGFAMAERADAVGKGEDARAAELLALAWFSRGDREKAIECQERAIALQKDVKLRRTYEAQLRKYRTQEPGPVPSAAKKGGSALLEESTGDEAESAPVR